MLKNEKTTLEKLEKMLSMVARNLAEMKGDMVEMKGNMATKDDIKMLEFKIEDTERKLSAKIDAVDEKVDGLEDIDIRDLQRRVFTLEKDVKQIKHKHV